jgi:hypothetical protein
VVFLHFSFFKFYSKKGFALYHHLNGYQKLFSTVELEKLKLLAKDPLSAICEKHLPFAVAIRSDHDWMRKFQDKVEVAFKWLESDLGASLSPIRVSNITMNMYHQMRLASRSRNSRGVVRFAGGELGGSGTRWW